MSIMIVILTFAPPLYSATIPTPQYLMEKGIAEKNNPIEMINTFLRIPFRDDGVLDENGRFTLFEHPEKSFKTPGFNCSGLVVSASRYLLNNDFSLEDSKHDRTGDSGPESELGDSWDFGLDLILNLTEDYERRILTPEGVSLTLEEEDGRKLRGFDIHDEDAWKSVIEQMKPGYLYLASLSKPTWRNKAQLLHYHVAVILPDDNGGIWFYHTTKKSHTHRINLNTQHGMDRLQAQFSHQRSGKKMILLLEVKLPNQQPHVEKAIVETIVDD